MSKLRTQEEYENLIKDKYGDDYTILSQYEGANKKIHVRHNICNREFDKNASKLLSQGCPLCGKDRANEINSKRNKQSTVTTKIFVDRVKQQRGEEYTVLGEYVANEEKILVRHNVCGTEWMVRPHSFLKGTGCPECNKKRQAKLMSKTMKKSLQSFLDEFNEKYENTPYRIVEDSLKDYKNRKSIIKIINIDTNNIYISTPHDALSKFSCPFLLTEVYEHGTFKGLNGILRSSILPWQIDTQKFYNKKCLITNNSTDVVIHHLSKNFNEIRDEVLQENNINIKNIHLLTREQIDKLRNDILDKHYYYGLGVVVNAALHKDFHKKYGVYNNTPDQFIEFAEEHGVFLEKNIENKTLMLKNT